MRHVALVPDTVCVWTRRQHEVRRERNAHALPRDGDQEARRLDHAGPEQQAAAERERDHDLTRGDAQDEGVGGERHDALDELAHRRQGVRRERLDVDLGRPERVTALKVPAPRNSTAYGSRPAGGHLQATSSMANEAVSVTS
jgi:hypothetical protein